jgi:predicted nucleic acid-binding protein
MRIYMDNCCFNRPFDSQAQVRVRLETVSAWRTRAVVDVIETPMLLENAKALAALEIRSKDALHVACAVEAGCEYFVTTDDILLKKLSGYTQLLALDPTAFVRSTEP